MSTRKPTVAELIARTDKQQLEFLRKLVRQQEAEASAELTKGGKK